MKQTKIVLLILLCIHSFYIYPTTINNIVISNNSIYKLDQYIKFKERIEIIFEIYSIFNKNLTSTSNDNVTYKNIDSEIELAKDTINHYKIKAKFIDANVLEGIGRITFLTKKREKISFYFNIWIDRNHHSKYFLKEALPNEELLGQWFNIVYKTEFIVPEETLEKIKVNRIISFSKITK
ncbi:hypothetical protein [Tenacibaculum agarivorans]|uniref:hypothetical protein n=1 Tax=Tenacibaculum agarivorans TaxID=1908389 RepID=UPI00094B9570|nr:hypothetical protein [Tenacibaculum agarivorans]